MFDKVLIHNVQIKSVIKSLFKLMNHIVGIKLSLRGFNILWLYVLVNKTCVITSKVRNLEFMQGRNVNKLAYIYARVELQGNQRTKKKKKKREREKREGCFLNLAHYKIFLSAKQGITRRQPPSLFQY